MSRPPLARAAVLDAYERLLVQQGERAATLDATAREAGVSKGGLLYHFASKDALTAGLIARMEQLTAEDVEMLDAAPDGPVAAFVRTSVMADTPLDRTITAVATLAQSGDTAAADALRRTRDAWERVLQPHTRDAAALNLVLLVGDGLYFNNALAHASVPGPVPSGAEMDALIALVEQAVRP